MPSIELTNSEETALLLVWAWTHDWIEHECAETRKIENEIFPESTPIFIVRSLLIGLAARGETAIRRHRRD